MKPHILQSLILHITKKVKPAIIKQAILSGMTNTVHMSAGLTQQELRRKGG